MSDEPEWDVSEDEDSFFEMPALSLLIRQYRVYVCKLTQSDLEREYGIDQSQLSDMENDRVKKPRLETLDRLARAFSDNCDQPHERILQYLVEARDQKPIVRGDDEGESQLQFRLKLYPPETRRRVLKLVNNLLDNLAEMIGEL